MLHVTQTLSLFLLGAFLLLQMKNSIHYIYTISSLYDSISAFIVHKYIYIFYYLYFYMKNMNALNEL